MMSSTTEISESKEAASNSSELPDEFSAKIAELTTWYKANPKLPEVIEPILLKRFLKTMLGDVKEAKKVIELNYSLRNQHAHLFLDRDPKHEKFMISREANLVAPLVGLTPDRLKVFIYRLDDVDPSVMDTEMEMRIFSMICDLRFAQPDDDRYPNELDNLADGDVHIADFKYLTWRHFMRMSMSLMRVNNKFLHEAFPVRLKQMHIVNCPSMLNRMIALARPIVPDEVFKMMHLHTEGLESLYEFVPKDMLPEDYGGKAAKLADLSEQWTEKLFENRDYLLDPIYWKEKSPTKRSRWAWW